jgi:NAD(P) transhydrogenase subunit alpha
VVKPAGSQAGVPVPARRRFAVVGAGAAVLFLLAALSPPALLADLTVFALAIVVGYYVIGHVHHALHTPLMSVTNAVSGIIVIGTLLQIGHGEAANGELVTALSTIAILLASVNVFGGFAVTRRMLSMFSRS